MRTDPPLPHSPPRVFLPFLSFPARHEGPIWLGFSQELLFRRFPTPPSAQDFSFSCHRRSGPKSQRSQHFAFSRLGLASQSGQRHPGALGVSKGLHGFTRIPEKLGPQPGQSGCPTRAGERNTLLESVNNSRLKETQII